MKRQSNECLIDFFRFSMPDYDLPKVAQLLGISIYHFSSENLGSPFPNYHKKVCFANIEVHFSTTHSNALINLSGQACRQYEEYMNKGEGWQWQKFLKTIIELNGKITRIDLALDIFDDLSPSVKTIQDYIKRGQLSTKAHKFVEINSGRISDGVLTGFTIYIGSAPQVLRIYDKANERLVNADEIILGKWIRWELELTDKKAQQVAVLIGEGKPLGYVIRGILAAHYSFKTQNKKIEIHNKSRLPNMKWWDNFICQADKIPLRIKREKLTLIKKKSWLEKSTSKSLAMVYQTLENVHGIELAKVYLNELVQEGKEKFTEADKSMIEQRVIELSSEDNY